MRNSPSAYAWMMLAAIAVSLTCWIRLNRKDSRLVFIYMGGLVGAFFGAKVVFLFAEGWHYWHAENRWVLLATGKSITGALFGGYAGVEFTKRLVGYRAATGDLFALIVPLGIMLGRIGCMLHGCCLGAPWNGPLNVCDAQGLPRWPAAHLEFVFNLCALAVLSVCRLRRVLPGQLFHLYLMAYGLFRFAHEFVRDTPKIAGWLTGYQVAALGLIALGGVRFYMRARIVRSEARATESVIGSNGGYRRPFP